MYTKEESFSILNQEFVNSKKGSSDECDKLHLCLKNLAEQGTSYDWTVFNNSLQSDKRHLTDCLQESIFQIKSREIVLKNAIYNANSSSLLATYISIADNFFPHKNLNNLLFWENLISRNNKEINGAILVRILLHKNEASIKSFKKLYFTHHDDFPVIIRCIAEKVQSLKDLWFIRKHAKDYFLQNLDEIITTLYKVNPVVARQSFNGDLLDDNQELIHSAQLKLEELRKQDLAIQAPSSLTSLFGKYLKSFSLAEQESALKKIGAKLETYHDFEELVILSSGHFNSKDGFVVFLVQKFFDIFEGHYLVDFYQLIKKQKNSAYLKAFKNNLEESKISFAFLKPFLDDSVNKTPEFNEFITELSLARLDKLEDVIFVCGLNILSLEDQLYLLSKYRNKSSNLLYWIKIYKKAEPASMLELFSSERVRTLAASRDFDNIYKIYMENRFQNGKKDSVLFKVLKEKIKNKKHLEKLLFIVPNDNPLFDKLKK